MNMIKSLTAVLVIAAAAAAPAHAGRGPNGAGDNGISIQGRNLNGAGDNGISIQGRDLNGANAGQPVAVTLEDGRVIKLDQTALSNLPHRPTSVAGQK